MFNIQNRKVKIMVIVLIGIILIVGIRIFMNISKDKKRAAKSSQAKVVSVEMAKPARATITPIYHFSGSLDPEWQADIAPKIDARISETFVKEGDRVEKGQVLASLEQTDMSATLFQAQGSYADAKAAFTYAEQNLKRYEQLHGTGAISAQQLDNYRNLYETSKAKLDSASGVLRAAESKYAATELVAPNDGIVAKRYYQDGYYAKAGTSIFSIANIDQLKIVIHVPEGQINTIAVGNKAKITLPSYNKKQLEGTIVRIAPVADLPSHTFQVEIGVDNKEQLRAGVYADVTLKGSALKNMLTIPTHAIIMRDDQKTLFVVNDKNVVERRVLDIGYSDENVTQVISGIKETDRFVSGGMNKLREGSVVKEGKAGK